MKEDITKPVGDATEEELFEDWFDPIETDVRTTVRGFIETMIGGVGDGVVAAALWTVTATCAACAGRSMRSAASGAR